MGDKVYIKVVAANLSKRQLDFEWVLKPDADDEEDKPKAKRSSKGKTREKKKKSV